ncbi:MAG: patatin-like phospholipase family protein [Bacteroidia bacterium]
MTCTRLRFISLLFFIIPSLAYSQSVGLVLSGGGARALAHIGVIKALEENHVPIDYITGTSMGALIGSMYATGLSADQMEKIVTSDDFIQRAKGRISDDFQYFYNRKDPDAGWVTIKFSYDSTLKIRLPESAINSVLIDYTLMESYAPAIAKANCNFDSLMVPFRCVAADIKNREAVVFSGDDLARAVRSSMAFPFYLTPVAVDNRIMFDGGLYNNFPCDVMLHEFHPDIIIGSSVGNSTEVVYEDNILSQVRTMIVQQATQYKVPRETDFLIVPGNAFIGVFDFSDAQQAIDSGYNATIKQMNIIKKAIKRDVSIDEITRRRAAFFDHQVPVMVDKISVNGLNKEQRIYVERILKPKHGPMFPYAFKKNYFRLVADDNIRAVFPKLIYNTETKFYDLMVDIKREKDLHVDFGGDFSSRPINTAFIGLQYNLLSKQSYRFYANTYLGKLYNSAHADIRIDFPGRTSFYVQPSFTYNSFNYYKSSNGFREDIKPPYLIQNDLKAGAFAGIPSRLSGKLYAEGAYFELNEKYYQTRQFLESDTTDRTSFPGFTYGLNYERNTLNRKMYANKGSFIAFYSRYVDGHEHTIPGSTSLNSDTINQHHNWLQFKFLWENYFAKAGPVKFGFYIDLVGSTQQFFANYTASILAAPAFQPIPETKAVFLPQYHCYTYGGAGLKTVYTPFTNFDLRLEGYLFQPYEEILPGENNDAPTFGEPFAKRYFIGAFNAVYHTPVGPISLGLNYYENFDKPLAFIFHFGYIIFNKKALD